LAGPPQVGPPREGTSPGRQPPPDQVAARPVRRLPPTDGVPLPPQSAPEGDFPRTEVPQVARQESPAKSRPRDARGRGEVVQASYEEGPLEESAAEWRRHLAAAIRAKEAELAGAKTPEDEARQAQLRLLYLLAGQREQALRPIPAAAPEVQAFWSEQLYGLGLWLDRPRDDDATRRAAEAKQHLAEAVGKLGDRCALVVRNVAFCSEIQSFGCIKQFEKYEFSAGQRLLLYAEVENFTSESTPKGHHTSLRSSYPIFDIAGRRVADEEFTLTEEYCRNPRRDYFTGYVLRLPERLYPGKYTLQLTIEDMKSRKIGQSSVEFTVKKAER